MSLFNFFKREPEITRPSQLGVAEDTRVASAKEKDYSADELVSFGPATWKVIPAEQWPKWPIFNQDGSSSCVANALARVLGINNFMEEGKWVRFSARDIYTRRANKPSEGMIFQDAGEIGKNHGATLEVLMPSEGKNEVQMNIDTDRTALDKYVGAASKIKGYVFIPVDIEKVAFMIQSGKPVLIGVAFGPGEWNQEVPKILSSNAPYRHAICGTLALLHDNKKAILIDDSWGVDSGFGGRRIVTEEWFTSGRIFLAMYFDDLSLGAILMPTKPVYKFEVDLKYGQTSTDIANLQDVLQREGLFPVNVDKTGLYGSVTAKAVLGFQTKYNLGTVEELTALAGKLVGPKTRAKLNELYAQ